MEGKGHLNPQVTGFASNAIVTQEFIGDFVLAPVGQDTKSTIANALKTSLSLFKNNRKKNRHIPLACAVIRSFSEVIKLAFIVVIKDDTGRFFKKQISKNELRNEYFWAFQLCETKATEMKVQQGLKYSSELDTIYVGLEEEFQYTNGSSSRANIHPFVTITIVALATSVPTPFYVAKEYAKRSRSLRNRELRKPKVLPLKLKAQSATVSRISLKSSPTRFGLSTTSASSHTLYCTILVLYTTRVPNFYLYPSFYSDPNTRYFQF
ncbi:unnamed protein product [Caenorhabditis brenneri]